jgi:hypothetical protein
MVRIILGFAWLLLVSPVLAQTRPRIREWEFPLILLLWLRTHKNCDGTELAQAQATTIRLKVLKIGALIRVPVRKVRIVLAGGYPYAELWARIWGQLQQLPLRG